MARVTGIGGVFFKARDPKALAAWYAKHLGITFEAWGGAILKWRDDPASDGGATVWHLAEQSSTWFHPSDASFMINYRVDNLEEMIAAMRANGVAIEKGPETDDNGTFAWVMDPEGHKVELWQPKG